MGEIRKAEIEGKKTILVSRLDVIAQGAPPVILGSFDKARPDRI